MTKSGRTRHEKVMCFLGAAAAADWDIGEDELYHLADAASSLPDCMAMVQAMRAAKSAYRVSAGLKVMADKNDKARADVLLERKLRAVK